jgi:hypothetical protein
MGRSEKAKVAQEGSAPPFEVVTFNGLNTEELRSGLNLTFAQYALIPIRIFDISCRELVSFTGVGQGGAEFNEELS